MTTTQYEVRSYLADTLSRHRSLRAALRSWAQEVRLMGYGPDTDPGEDGWPVIYDYAIGDTLRVEYDSLGRPYIQEAAR